PAAQERGGGQVVEAQLGLGVLLVELHEEAVRARRRHFQVALEAGAVGGGDQIAARIFQSRIRARDEGRGCLALAGSIVRNEEIGIDPAFPGGGEGSQERLWIPYRLDLAQQAGVGKQALDQRRLRARLRRERLDDELTDQVLLQEGEKDAGQFRPPVARGERQVRIEQQVEIRGLEKSAGRLNVRSRLLQVLLEKVARLHLNIVQQVPQGRRGRKPTQESILLRIEQHAT